MRRQNRTALRKHMEWEARYEARRIERQESLRLWRQENRQNAMWAKRAKDQPRSVFHKQKDEIMSKAGYVRRRRKKQKVGGGTLGREQTEGLRPNLFLSEYGGSTSRRRQRR